MRFDLNGYSWKVIRVAWDDPRLIDRTGNATIGTTDAETGLICLADWLTGNMLERVLIHEMAHAVMVSYGLDEELARMVKPGYKVEAEEWVCNFLADYGALAFERARKVLGCRALGYVPDMIANVL